MANNYTKTMRQALQEARSFRDVQEGFSTAQIKMAYGVLNDPRYKQGNYDGAVKAIEKIAKGLSDHPDVKNALKRANEELLDLPATGDTTTSNASQELEQVEDLKEYTGMGNLPKSVNSNDVATALKNLKKGTKLYVQGKSQGGMRTMGDVISVSGDTVKIKPTASNGPKSVNVKDITMMDTLKEELDEARFSKAQIDALKRAYAPLKGKTDYTSATGSLMNFNKLKNKMSSYSPSHLLQLSTADIPMVSDAAKELLAKKDKRFSEETELDEASRLRPTKGLYSMAQMKQQVARTEKAFNEFKQHCDFIFQMDRDVGPSMSDNSGKYFDVYSDLDDANKLIKKALADAKKIT